jgi:dTDP-4-amino-4,6-dideoxygalactose transaminase
MHTLSTATPLALVDLKAQYNSIKSDVDAAITEVLTDTSFIGGPHVQAFEEAFARYCGVAHSIGVANGTDALFLALKALGVGPGDEVVTAANSFIATSEAIRMAGAQCVFVDINPATFTIDTDLIEDKITPKTKAIIPVHLYGQPVDMAAITSIAGRHGLRVIADAAQAHGAQYRGQPIAQFADATCFSFYPGKNLGAYGDAGAVVTNNAEWATAVRMMANHGRTRKYDHDFEGVNSRLDGLQGAVLSVKLRHLTDWTQRRRANARRYNAVLAERNIVTPTEIEDVQAVYHLYVVRVPDGKRDALQEYLKTQGISTGIHYPIPLPYLKAYAYLGHTPADFPESRRASAEILSLPMFPELRDEQIEYVAGKISAFGL